MANGSKPTKEAKAAAKAARKQASKERRTQLWQAFQIQRKEDKLLLPWMIGVLVAGLAARGLTDSVNLVIVADHGMSAVSTERQIFLDDYIDLAAVTVVDWSPVAAIRPQPGKEDAVYARLKGAHPQLEVYRKAEIPARLHYRASPRITPILAVAADGWHIARRSRPLGGRGGSHGYDPMVPSMGALFVAAGPDLKRGLKVESLNSIHLYELLARLAGLPPARNDGSLDSVRVLLRP